MKGAMRYTAYWRANPHRFCHDYLHLDLKLFQKLLLCMMMWCTQFVFCGARGIGKSFLSAVYCVTRAILYPGSKIIIVSGTRGQAVNVLTKIQHELMPRSKELTAEIEQIQINGTNAKMVFKNSSYIEVVTASDSARGHRANVLIIDEFRLVNKDVIDTVLRKFLTLKRMPPYRELSKEERKEEYAKEHNITMWLSSAFFADHWSFSKCRDTLKAMLDETKRQFVCGFPYQLSIVEGLLDETTIQDEMLEADFNEVKFSMEYECLWWGCAEGAFFDFESVSKNRKIRLAMLPDKVSSVAGAQFRIPSKQNGEIRILSADIALMSSTRHNNDATSIFINQMLLTKSGRYTRNIIYADSCEGLRTEAQSLVIRSLFDEYSCDYIAIDSNGVGLGCFDCLTREMVDQKTGDVYPALSCCNDPDMAARCADRDAPKVIWSIKANAQFNSDAAFMLREDLKSGRIKLLVSEYDAEDEMAQLKSFGSLSESDKVKILAPYIHTTLLVNELVNLRHDESQGRVKITEKSGMRKDRYSSLMYNNYVASQIEIKKLKDTSFDYNQEWFVAKAPSYKRKENYGRSSRI